MDWSARKIHQQQQGSNHFLRNGRLNESAPPQTADQSERELFTAHHPHRLPHHLNPLLSPFHYHYPRYQHTLHHPQDMHYGILREMEKEKIREEIIKSELARRRALEAEVRYELMLERGLLPGRDFLSLSRLGLPLARSGSSQRRPLEEKTEMSHENEKPDMSLLGRVETDRKTSEEVKASPFLLPERAENLSGSKRKSPETSQGKDAGEHGSSSKTKAKEAWSCALCLFSSTSKQGLDEHLSGQKHKASEDALRAENARKNHGAELSAKKGTSSEALPLKNETKEALQKNEARPVQKLEEEGEVKTNDKKYKFWCEVCEVGTFSKKVMKTHETGRKHIRRVQNRGRKDVCVAPLPVKNEEPVVAEEENKRVAISKSDPGDILEEDNKPKEEDVAIVVLKPEEDLNGDKSKNGENEVGTTGCGLVDEIKEEDWWAYMDVANAENGLIDDEVKLIA